MSIDSTFNCLWKTNKIGRNSITLISGFLSIILASISGTLDPTENANLLKNLSISFGAVITGLQLFLWFVINSAADLQADNPEEANKWLEQLGQTPDKPKINNMINNTALSIGQMIDALNKAKDNLQGDDKAKLINQIKLLDFARASLGAEINIQLV